MDNFYEVQNIALIAYIKANESFNNSKTAPFFCNQKTVTYIKNQIYKQPPDETEVIAQNTIHQNSYYALLI